MEVAIIGQGYVGLTVSMGAFTAGFRVIGIDNSSKVVESISARISHIEGISNKQIETAISSGRFFVSSDFSVVENADVVVLAVPTPLTQLGEPDLSILGTACESVAPYLKSSVLVVNESTSNVGTLREFIAPKIRAINPNVMDFAVSPERVDPGNEKFSLANTPRLVGGISKEVTERTAAFYATFCDEVVPVSSPEVAEAAKLLENTFRYVNIGFIDEFAKIMNAMNIPVEEVIKAASTKPYGFMPFYPNIGIGGHCIPVDPHYLQQEALKVGLPSKFINLTSKVNAEMPGHLISAVNRKLGGLSGKKCLLIGVTYKPNIADTRETPASEVVRELTGQGVDVKWHDPLVEKWNGEESSPVDGQYDFGIVLAAHDALNLKKWKAAPIFSVRSDKRHPEWISLIDLGSEV